MVDRPQRHWGASENVSPVASVQVRRGIPIADHEQLRDAGRELTQRIGRLGLEDRLALLEMMKEQFPDPAIDKSVTSPAVAAIVARSGVAPAHEGDVYTPDGGSEF